jgi:hypothetical protein
MNERGLPLANQQSAEKVPRMVYASRRGKRHGIAYQNARYAALETVVAHLFPAGERHRLSMVGGSDGAADLAQAKLDEKGKAASG